MTYVFFLWVIGSKTPCEKEMLTEKLQIDTEMEMLAREIFFLLSRSCARAHTHIEEVLKRKQTGLILVPEISLTPQFIRNFKARFDFIGV